MTFISFRNLDIFRIKTNTISKIEIKIKPLTIRFTRFCVNIMVIFFQDFNFQGTAWNWNGPKIDIYLAMFLSRFVRIIPLIISKIIPISHIHFFFVYLWVLLESIYYHFFDTISDINYNKRLFFSWQPYHSCSWTNLGV